MFDQKKGEKTFCSIRLRRWLSTFWKFPSRKGQIIILSSYYRKSVIESMLKHVWKQDTFKNIGLTIEEKELKRFEIA